MVEEAGIDLSITRLFANATNPAPGQILLTAADLGMTPEELNVETGDRRKFVYSITKAGANDYFETPDNERSKKQIFNTQSLSGQPTHNRQYGVVYGVTTIFEHEENGEVANE